MIVALVKGVLIIFVLATGFAYMTFAERKISARIQLRLGTQPGWSLRLPPAGRGRDQALPQGEGGPGGSR